MEQGLCRKGLTGPWWLGSILVGGPCPGPTGYCPRCDSRCMGSARHCPGPQHSPCVSGQAGSGVPVALLAAVVLLGGLTGHGTVLRRQEKSHHQLGIGMKGLTLQASPSGDTVDPPGTHPHPGLPSAGRSRRQAWQRSRGKRGCQRVPSGASLTSPPAPCSESLAD